jgi:hypothetical protein
MANHKARDEDRRTVLVGYKASAIDLAVLKQAQEQMGLSTQAEVIRQAVRLHYAGLYAVERQAHAERQRRQMAGNVRAHDLGGNRPLLMGVGRSSRPHEPRRK